MKDLLKKMFITGLFTGYSPVMPGTCGTFIGVGIFLLVFPYPFILYILMVLFFLFGVKFSDWGEQYFKKKDSSKIVIDEIVGFFISVSSLPLIFSMHDHDFWYMIIIGFVLFRFFDIVKPFYIKRLQKIPGGLGVMIDDVLAGVYTNIILLVIVRYKDLIF